MTTKTITTERGEAPVYRAGTLAYLDSFAGMIPVTVLSVTSPGHGWQAAPASGEITARVNVTRGGYSRGEIITRGAHDIVPRTQHRYRGGHGRINSLYVWA